MRRPRLRAMPLARLVYRPKSRCVTPMKMKRGGAYLRYGVIFRVSVLREEEVDELDDVEAAEERRAMGAGVGALLRMDSDLFREPDPGCA